MRRFASLVRASPGLVRWIFCVARNLQQNENGSVNGVAVLTKNRPGVYLQVKPFPGLIVKVVLEIIGSPRDPQKLAL